MKSSQRPEFTYQMFDTYLRSTVLGGRVVAEILGGGQKSRGYVYTPEGGRLAFHQLPIPGDVGNYVGIEHSDATGQSVRVGGAQEFDAELDAVGVQMGTAEQYVAPEPAPTPDEADPSPFPAYGNPGNRVGLRCSRDGIPLECEFILGGLKSEGLGLVEAQARQSARFLGVRLHVEYAGPRERPALLRWWARNIYDGSWGFAPTAAGGAGGAAVVQPQNPRPDLPDWAQSVYKGKLGKKLTDCINKVFSKYVDEAHAKSDPSDPTKKRVGKGSDLLEYQQLKNAPKIMWRDMPHGRGGATAVLDGEYGRIRISPSAITDIPDQLTGKMISAFEIGQRVYVHELGNYLSDKIVHYIDPEGKNLLISLDYFGNPNGIGSHNGIKPDVDSGAALEECVFGFLAP